MESNWLKPYNYYPNYDPSNVTYDFVTDSGIEYHVYFSDGSGYFPKYPDFCDNIMMIGFGTSNKSKDNVVKRKIDYRIRDTIFKILIESADIYPERSYMLVCDQHDHKQACRNELFKKWFLIFSDHYKDKFVKKDIAINSDGSPYSYLSMLIPVG